MKLLQTAFLIIILVLTLTQVNAKRRRPSEPQKPEYTYVIPEEGQPDPPRKKKKKDRKKEKENEAKLDKLYSSGMDRQQEMLDFKFKQLSKVPNAREQSERDVERRVGGEELQKEKELADKIKESEKRRRERFDENE